MHYSLVITKAIMYILSFRVFLMPALVFIDKDMTRVSAYVVLPGIPVVGESWPIAIHRFDVFYTAEFLDFYDQ